MQFYWPCDHSLQTKINKLDTVFGNVISLSTLITDYYSICSFLELNLCLLKMQAWQCLCLFFFFFNCRVNQQLHFRLVFLPLLHLKLQKTASMASWGNGYILFCQVCMVSRSDLGWSILRWSNSVLNVGSNRRVLEQPKSSSVVIICYIKSRLML